MEIVIFVGESACPHETGREHGEITASGYSAGRRMCPPVGGKIYFPILSRCTTITYGTNVCFDDFLWLPRPPLPGPQTNWKANGRFEIFVWLRITAQLRPRITSTDLEIVVFVGEEQLWK